MSQDIETIDKHEKIIIVNITLWRPIYEVIDEAYIKDSNIFPDDFIRGCEKNSIKPQSIKFDVKII